MTNVWWVTTIVSTVALVLTVFLLDGAWMYAVGLVAMMAMVWSATKWLYAEESGD